MSFDWGSVIGAAVSLWGGKQQADAAKDAGKQAAAGAQQDAAPEGRNEPRLTPTDGQGDTDVF